MVPTKMKVIEMDNLVIRNYVTGCKRVVDEARNSGTYIEGYGRGIDDGLKLVDSEQDLTFVMRMAVLGLRHQFDNTRDAFLIDSQVVNYKVGYGSGLENTIEILTGKKG